MDRTYLPIYVPYYIHLLASTVRMAISGPDDRSPPPPKPPPPRHAAGGRDAAASMGLGVDVTVGVWKYM